MSSLLFGMLGEAGQEESRASHGLGVVKHKERLCSRRGALRHQLH